MSYIIYPNFNWICEEVSIDTLETFINNSTKDIIIENTNDRTEIIINNFIKNLKELWLSFIKKIKKIFKNIMKAVENSIKIIKDEDKKISLNLPFTNKTFMSRNFTKQKLVKITSIYNFYDRILDALHFILVFIKKAYINELDRITRYKNSILSYDKNIVNESKVKLYSFPGEMIGLDSIFIGEELLNQFFIENCKIFNNIDIETIINGKEYQENVLKAFSSDLIRNIQDLFNKRSEYYKTNEKLINGGYITNIALSNFLECCREEITDPVNNEDLAYNINLYVKTYADNNQLIEVLKLIKLKSEVIIEAITNILKYDMMTAKIGEIEIQSKVTNIKPEELNKIKSIIQNNKDDIFKHNGRYLDFSKFNLGSVCILEDEGEYRSLIKKYMDFNFSSILLYFISKYDFSIISHGWVDSYKNLYDFKVKYSQYGEESLNIFKECYSEELSVISDIINKDFDDITDKDGEYFESFISSGKYISYLRDRNVNYNNCTEFIYTYKQRWYCDKVYIPQVNTLMTDVEIIIYIMNINKIKKLNISICNNNFIINPKVINFFDNMTVWIAKNKLIE